MENKENKIDLNIKANHYFDAAVSNARFANESVQSMQNWLLIFSIAELTFLGSTFSLEFNRNQEILNVNIITLISISCYLLLLNFTSFFIGCMYQHAHLLKTARAYNQLSQYTHEFAKNYQRLVDKTPSFLDDKDLSTMKTNQIANACFFVSLVSILLATVTIVVIFPYLFYKL